LYIYGRNDRGQLGLGDTKERRIPTQITGYGEVVQFFISDNNTAFINTTGQTYVFGGNNMGKLGNADDHDLIQPTILMSAMGIPLMGVQKICFGEFHMLILANNSLYVCGKNIGGALGIGDFKGRLSIPYDVDKFNGKKITDIAASSNCSYVVADKKCYSTGENYEGELGLGTTTRVFTFTQLPLLPDDFVSSIDTVQIRAGSEVAALILS
jgi:alpha-tubulin suppressor-like RCC1 family protein